MLDTAGSWRLRLQRRYYRLHMVTHSHQDRSESAQLLMQLGRSPDIDVLDYADSTRAAP